MCNFVFPQERSNGGTCLYFHHLFWPEILRMRRTVISGVFIFLCLLGGKKLRKSKFKREKIT